MSTPPDRGQSSRRSRSADEARAAEIARVRAMTPKARMALALSLGRRRRLLEQRLARARKADP